MLVRHEWSGLPLTRTRTGMGLRQPDLMVLARAALTRTYGFEFRIFIVAANSAFMLRARAVRPLRSAIDTLP
jgi:hypothetical protein